MATPGLAAELQSLYLTLEITGLDATPFWDMVARLLLSGDIPTDYSRREGPTFADRSITGFRIAYTPRLCVCVLMFYFNGADV